MGFTNFYNLQISLNFSLILTSSFRKSVKLLGFSPTVSLSWVVALLFLRLIGWSMGFYINTDASKDILFSIVCIVNSSQGLLGFCIWVGT